MIGQVVDLKFPALADGTFDVQVGCYSDCWIGSDKVVPIKMTIKKATKVRSATKPSPQEISSEEEPDAPSVASSSEDDADNNSESAVNEDEYDSEETGELETGTDEASDTDQTEQ